MDDHLERLLSGLESGDGMARKRARETLVLVGDTATPRLRALLASSDKNVRWEAAKALGAVIDPGSADTFVQLLDDPSSDLRWLAATGLIELGPRSVRPVLQSLTDPSVPRGHLEMSHRVLGELATGNGVLADIVGPVVEMLGRTDRGVIVATAARALSDLDRATGRPPDPDAAPATTGETAPPG